MKFIKDRRCCEIGARSQRHIRYPMGRAPREWGGCNNRGWAAARLCFHVIGALPAGSHLDRMNREFCLAISKWGGSG